MVRENVAIILRDICASAGMDCENDDCTQCEYIDERVDAVLKTVERKDD